MNTNTKPSLIVTFGHESMSMLMMAASTRMHDTRGIVCAGEMRAWTPAQTVPRFFGYFAVGPKRVRRM